MREMKRMGLLLVTAMAACAVMTGCTTKQEDIPTLYLEEPADTEEESEEIVPESTPAASPAVTTATPAPAEGDPLMEPDLWGPIISVEETCFTVMPVTTASAGDGAVVAEGGTGNQVTVYTENAVFETMKIYNGGHEEPQPAEESILKSGTMVYLYGSAQEDTFEAERVIALVVGDEAK